MTVKDKVGRFVYNKLNVGNLLAPYAVQKLSAGNGAKSIEQAMDFAFNFNCFEIRIAPQQVRSELAGLLEIVKELKPKTILEIGSASGGTLYLFSKFAAEKAKIISIDMGHPAWREKTYKASVLPSQELNLLKLDSHDATTLERVKGILAGSSIDFLFIDGDHSYKGVRRDFELYSELVAKDGLIALHDIARHPIETGCEVDRFWNEIKDKYNSKELIENQDQRWGGIGVLKVTR